MKRINKKLELARSYKIWLENLEDLGKLHPEYSSQKPFYIDIKCELLFRQTGLCAYSEMFLQDPEIASPQNWNEEGRHIGNFQKRKIAGSLDHFNPDLKEKRGWDWGNLFLVDSDINNHKQEKKVPPYLKPDLEEYQTQDFMLYHSTMHIFYPNPKLTEPQLSEVEQGILDLGLNLDFLIDRRRKFLSSLFVDLEFGLENFNDVLFDSSKLYQFPTAFQLSRDYIQSIISRSKG